LIAGRLTSEIIMTIKQTALMGTLLAFSGLAGVALSASAADAGPIVPRGHYCLDYAEGGTDCGFTSYSQCLATASGIAAECYGDIARDDAKIGRSF
jgi:Protein of unknown function (DUF3551)